MKLTPFELDTLIGKFLDAQASEEELAQLSELLESNAEVQQRYLQVAKVHASLAADESLWESPAEPQLRPVAVKTGRMIPFWHKPLAAVAVAVAAVAAVLSAMWWWKEGKPKEALTEPVPEFAVDGPVSIPAQAVPPLAVLKQAAGVEWQLGSQTYGVGETLGAGWLRLLKGSVLLEFLSGARLLVEGPAELRLDSENAAFLQAGTASAYVPEPAHGFRLLGPGMEVKDLGTAFGFAVAPGKAPEVHVFDGSVVVSATGGLETQTLEADKAVAFQDKEFRHIPVRQKDFPNGSAMAKMAHADDQKQLLSWKQQSADFSTNPATLLHFTFDDPLDWRRSVKNHAARGEAGTLVGAGKTTGRWPEKSAVEFRSIGDRLRFHAPGTHAALTLMAWLRVDSLPNDYNSLLLPSTYQAGSVHWTLERGGELRLTMLNQPTNPLHFSGWDGPVSGSAISSMDFGRWVMLATTYDSASGDVLHYCDGAAIGRGRFKHRFPAVLGNMEFGNWGAETESDSSNTWWKHQPGHQRLRNFVGRLDALVILARALQQGEIAAVYEAGRP